MHQAILANVDKMAVMHWLHMAMTSIDIGVSTKNRNKLGLSCAKLSISWSCPPASLCTLLTCLPADLPTCLLAFLPIPPTCLSAYPLLNNV